MSEVKGAMLMLIVTLGCNVECEHCCLACDRQKSKYKLDTDSMIYHIRNAHETGIGSVGFGGGEPMLCDLREPMAVAQELGMYVDVRTNAYWATDYERSILVLDSMKRSGLRRLGLSFDEYHSRRISKEYFTNALQAARALDLAVYVDWIGLEARDEVLRYLNIAPSELRFVGAPLRIGRATELEEQCFQRYPQETFLPLDSCGKGVAPFLTVYPGGYAAWHSCCWVNPALIKKVDIQGTDWLCILRNTMETSPMVRFLEDYGIGGLLRRGYREKPELVKPYYSHQCEICFDLLGEFFLDEVQALPQYIEDFKGLHRMDTVSLTRR